MRVLGIDGCSRGWIGVVIDGASIWAQVSSSIADLIAGAGPVAVVAIDMPIGLPSTGRRRADDLARSAIGPRGSSVFTTPVRAALEADLHSDASAINRQRVGEGISAQAFALRTRIFEVDTWVRSATTPVIEVHPEVSFAKLAGGHVLSRKSTWAGAKERERLLRGAGIVLDESLGRAGHNAGVDDVLDAAVAAWSARRYAVGAAMSLPSPPELLPDGSHAAIWA